MYLRDILDYKKMEVAEFKKRHSYQEFERKINVTGRMPFFEGLKLKEGIGVIAEIKKASPSQGILCEDFDPVRIAKDYEEIGINAISVLTDRKFFQGDITILKRVRETVSLPLLRKDFIIDEIQVLEAKAAGADAILLIAAAMPPSRLKALHQFCLEAGLEPLVEIHDEKDLKASLDCGAAIIGVNNRNLATFRIDLENSVRLIPQIPKENLRISESGIETPEHIDKIARAGANAFLIGTAFMKSRNKKALLKELLHES